MCAKKRHTKSSDFLRYLKDDLSNQERYALEKKLESDPFEKDAMEGLEGIGPEKAEGDILSLHASLRRRLGRRRRRTWYGIAATAASILIVGTIFLNIYDLNPDEANREPLTEESFRSLDPGKEETPATVEKTSEDESIEKSREAKKAEAKAQKKAEPEAQAKAQPDAQPDAQAKAEPMAQAKTEAQAGGPPASERAAAQAPERDREEQALDMVTEDKAEILAVEAEPKKSKQAAGKEKSAAPVAFTPAAAKTGLISGVVVSSEDMDPLPGASIVIRGTNSGTVSDMEGCFSLPSDDSQATVVASFIGMETEEYQLTSERDNRLVMQPDPLTLDEVVVMDHGSESVRRELASTGNVVKTREASSSYSAAEPADGYKAFQDYVEENMALPSDYTPGDRMLVILRFTVTSTGSLTGMETLRSPGEAYTLEAIRLIKEGPGWIPARTENGPIDEQVRIRIVFKKSQE